MIKMGVYKHYKGNLYEAVNIVVHSETLEKMVLYRAIEDEQNFWVRPLSMWNNIIDVAGKQLKRFEFVDNK